MMKYYLYSLACRGSLWVLDSRQLRFTDVGLESCVSIWRIFHWPTPVARSTRRLTRRAPTRRRRRPMQRRNKRMRQIIFDTETTGLDPTGSPHR